MSIIIITSDSLQLSYWKQMRSFLLLLLFVFGALSGQTFGENFARCRAHQMLCDGVFAMTFIRTLWAFVWRFFSTLDVAMETQCFLAGIRSLAGTIIGGDGIVKNCGTISAFPIFDWMSYWKSKRKKEKIIELFIICITRCNNAMQNWVLERKKGSISTLFVRYDLGTFCIQAFKCFWSHQTKLFVYVNCYWKIFIRQSVIFLSLLSIWYIFVCNLFWL